MKNDLNFDAKLLAGALRRSRELTAVSFRRLAKDSGVSTSQILRIESGEFDCLISSMIKVCGALGIRFGELLERCVLPDYELYRVAMEDEFKTDYPHSLPSDDESKEACKDLVLGGCVAIIHLLRAANVNKTLGDIDFPGADVADHFSKIASSLELHPPTLSTRTAFFEKLQQSPLSTLLRYYHFPTADQIRTHVEWVADSKKRNKGFLAPWFPVVWRSALPHSEEVDLFYTPPDTKKDLNHTSINRKVKGMGIEMEKLLDDVRTLVAPKGMKAKLADDLEVPQSRLSEWLSGAHEPGGTVTLKLYNWVTKRASKTEGSGSVSAQPERQTRKMKVTHENQKSNPRKR